MHDACKNVMIDILVQNFRRSLSLSLSDLNDWLFFICDIYWTDLHLNINQQCSVLVIE